MNKILNKNFSLIKYPKVMSCLKEGHGLFIKYNYYFIIFAFAILYLGLDLTEKLNNLNLSYNNNNIGYKHFIKIIQNWSIYIYFALVITYLYTFISYIFYNLENKSKKIDYHPLIINIAYFIILAVELKNHESEQHYAINMIVVDIIIFITLIWKKRSFYIITKPFQLVLKIFFLVIISYFIINIKYVVLTYELVKKKISITIKSDTNQLLKKQNFIIKNSYIDINNNDLHIVLKVKDNKTE